MRPMPIEGIHDLGISCMPLDFINSVWLDQMLFDYLIEHI